MVWCQTSSHCTVSSLSFLTLYIQHLAQRLSAYQVLNKYSTTKWIEALKYFIYLYKIYLFHLPSFSSFINSGINLLKTLKHFRFFFAMLQSLWNLSSSTSDWTWATTVQVPSSNHWITREFGDLFFKVYKFRFFWNIQMLSIVKIQIICVFN